MSKQKVGNGGTKSAGNTFSKPIIQEGAGKTYSRPISNQPPKTEK